MDQQQLPEVRTNAPTLWQKARVWVDRLPAKAWIVLGLCLVAGLLMAVHTAFAAKDAVLRLKVQHSFRSAQLSVWVDSDLAYSAKLIGTGKKKFGLIPDSVQGSLSETLPISSGIHQIRVRVASDDGSAQEDNISSEFARNSQRTLAVVARRSDVSLNWQGAASSVAEPSSSPGGWIQHYASTLLLTAAGSIISAITGYAIRELPKQIISRGEVPKV
jgi:hypothetical protein